MVNITALNHAKKLLDIFSPDGQVERLVFKRFPGDVLQQAAISGDPVEDSKIQTVRLMINPASVRFDKRKINQKVQTSSPGRFVIFDWGHDLTVLDIQGNTGNLLPDAVTQGIGDPVSKALVSAVSWSPNTADALTGSDGWKSAQNVFSEIDSFNTMLMGNLTYTELLEMSPKYRRFKQLEALYQAADADNDIITLEMSRNVFRGYFEGFSFSIDADSPWNWKYSINFVVLQDLASEVFKDDPTYKRIYSFDNS
jgi:hypothetical protein